MKINLQNVSKIYRDAERELFVINNLNFEIEPESTLAIIGRSGVGKSTLLHLIGGLDRASRGKVLFDGLNTSELGDEALAAFRLAHIGFIFQFHHLLSEFSARENVALPLIIKGESELRALEVADSWMERVGLADRKTHRPGELSGGEQQRVAIARAIVNSPSMILADEPTGNLDLESAKQIRDLLLKIKEEIHAILVIVTHSLELARYMQNVYEMQAGGELVKI